MKTIQIADPANKNQLFIYTGAMQPVGIVHCFSATEWQAFNAEGVFVDWFTSKKAAIAAIA